MITAKRQFDLLTTAKCRFVVKSLIIISWESIAIGVIAWEHYMVSEGSRIALIVEPSNAESPTPMYNHAP